MLEPQEQDLGIALYIILIFVTFISGLFLGASFSPSRHNARQEPEPWHARLAVAEGEPKHDRRNLLAVLLALVVVGGVIVADRVKGPLFHDVAYCLNDGGAQTTRMCTGRVPP
jgi:hypothetical protein